MNEQANCEKPRCNGVQEKTYTGENGNKLKLCEKHYYNLVANGNNTTVNIDSTDPVTPFWDSGIRCEDNISQDTVDDIVRKSIEEANTRNRRQTTRRQGGPL